MLGDCTNASSGLNLKLVLGKIVDNSVAAGGLWNGVAIDLSFSAKISNARLILSAKAPRIISHLTTRRPPLRFELVWSTLDLNDLKAVLEKLLSVY